MGAAVGILVGEFMPVVAVRLPKVDRCWGVTPPKVLVLRHRFEVLRAPAQHLTTEMIGLVALRDRSDNNLVGDPMDALMLSPHVHAGVAFRSCLPDGDVALPRSSRKRETNDAGLRDDPLQDGDFGWSIV